MASREPSPSASQMESLTVLLTEQGLVDYEGDLRSKGITEPHHLLRLTPAVIESLIPDKPIHQRKLAALSRGRNLNASTFSMEIQKGNTSAPPRPAPFRSKSADDVLPEKAGLRKQKSDLSLPDLAPDLKESVISKFGDDFGPMAEKFLKLQGVVDNSDLKHVDMVSLVESVKDAGGKPIQLGKLKDWIAIQGQIPPVPVETQPNPNEAAAEADDGKGKKKKPKPKRDTRPVRSSSTNDVTEEIDDPIEGTLVSRFGQAYSESVRSFLMTQGVLQEDDLMVRDEIKMLATAKLVGVKNVQLSKLKIWMREMKELGDGPARTILPHEREGSKLKLTKDRPSRQSKSFVAPVPKQAKKEEDMSL